MLGLQIILKLIFLITVRHTEEGYKWDCMLLCVKTQ